MKTKHKWTLDVFGLQSSICRLKYTLLSPSDLGIRLGNCGCRIIDKTVSPLVWYEVDPYGGMLTLSLLMTGWLGHTAGL